MTKKIRTTPSSCPFFPDAYQEAKEKGVKYIGNMCNVLNCHVKDQCSELLKKAIKSGEELSFVDSEVIIEEITSEDVNLKGQCFESIEDLPDVEGDLEGGKPEEIIEEIEPGDINIKGLQSIDIDSNN